MKRIFKWLLFILLLGGFINSCIYHRITHMNDEELEWVTNRKKGEKMYFKSPNAIIDTLTILEVYFHNDLNPINWGYFNTSGKEYIATAQVRYGFNNGKKGGILKIVKRFNDKPICFSSVLSEVFLHDVPLRLTSLHINGITINDYFENSSIKSTNKKDSANPIIRYAWSKKYGLVQYTFQDGTIFSRIDIG